MWEELIDEHCTTWYENFGRNARSECHAWGCAPAHEFSANVLGVKYSFENEISIAPHIGHLTFAKGRVPTRFYFVDVEWSISEGKFNIAVNSPSGITKNLTMPNGKEYTFTENDAAFSCEI